MHQGGELISLTPGAQHGCVSSHSAVVHRCIRTSALLAAAARNRRCSGAPSCGQLVQWRRGGVGPSDEAVKGGQCSSAVPPAVGVLRSGVAVDVALAGRLLQPITQSRRARLCRAGPLRGGQRAAEISLPACLASDAAAS